jgi:oxygen-independent coproporphyrinogen III oxidase
MIKEVVNSLLTRKYNVPVPRYTSYPTVPFWKDEFDAEKWAAVFKTKYEEQNHLNGIALYIHLPFCESLCTYCGCNKKITTNHKVEQEYLDVIEKEWLLYRKLMKQTPVIREIHLGGGTPTFFSPENLQKLLQLILNSCIIHPQPEFSIEGHPNNTTKEHLKVLYEMGFRRISYGVQDLDPDVQKIINRVQPFQILKDATENAREAGFTSVNYDLIYGLPLQTIDSIEKTINKVIELKPDRIAFYSYAHVPWTSKSQRLFDESHLPDPDKKLQLYLRGKELLLSKGYVDIGMDHFALPTDDLYIAWKSGKLHRNFMGYTTTNSGLLLGLGVSAISDIGIGFAQNAKTLHDYYALINSGRMAIYKGYFLTTRDISFRKYILDISCKGETWFKEDDLPILEQQVFPKLLELEKDGLVEWNRWKAKLTEQGHYFIRNVCSAFDLYLNPNNTQAAIFSKAI